MSFLNNYAVLFALAWLAFVIILTERGTRLKLDQRSDQKCPHCDKWQSEHGGWARVGSTENPEIDFAAECGNCAEVSYWVWIGPGVCATYEEIYKTRASK